jgi:transposase-like protein
MPKRYPPEFRRAVCTRLVAGEKVISLSKELGVSEATLHLWKRQALIDAGRAEGVKSFEADELAHPGRGARGVRLGPQGVLAAAFVHRTSRAGDSQLHTHVLVANVAQGDDGASPRRPPDLCAHPQGRLRVPVEWTDEN